MYTLVATQLYKTGSPEEYVILGNDALLKCNIPSFVADFVSVHSWEDSEGSMFHQAPNSPLPASTCEMRSHVEVIPCC